MSRFGRVLYRLRGPVLAAAVDAAVEPDGALPRPMTPAQVHARGANPDRLLLLGGALVQGFGVMSHDLGLAGQLARRISALTGRGVDLAVASRRKFTVSDAVQLLSAEDLRRYDALVLMIGKREVSGLQPRSVWAQELTGLFNWLESSAPHRVRTFVVAIPRLADFIDLPTALGEQLARHAARMNAVTASLIRDRPRITLLPFEPGQVETPPRFSTAASYERWAEVLAPDIARTMQALGGHPHTQQPSDENARQQALDRLRIVGTAPDDRLDHLVGMARDALGVAGSMLNFVDRDRSWVKAAASMSTEDTERMHSFCATTIQQPELFVVENAAERAEFADFPSVTGEEHIRFYAGYPIEAPDGQRVGAFCVVDTEARRFSTTDAAILREFALRAQQLVWGLADGQTAT